MGIGRPSGNGARYHRFVIAEPAPTRSLRRLSIHSARVSVRLRLQTTSKIHWPIPASGSLVPGTSITDHGVENAGLDFGAEDEIEISLDPGTA